MKVEMKKKPHNLFKEIPEQLDHELVEKLLGNNAFRIERIVSRGHSSSSEFWYDQDEHEWVAVLSGKAQLQIKGQEDPITLNPGDTYTLPAHTNHRVSWTAPNCDTVWLAVFWKSE